MLTRKRFSVPRFSDGGARDINALAKAVAEYLLSLEDLGVLTIAGATIDNTPIGATTAAAGKFTTVNGNTITTGTGTLTLGAGKAFTASNTLTLTGTDGTSLNINAVATLNSGAYTPTLTNITNVAASTMREAFWTRIGNVVHVSGYMNIDTTAGAATTTAFRIDLPVASNLANNWELAGSGAWYWGDVDAVYIDGDAANDAATFIFSADSTANNGLTYNFSYRVL